MGKYLWYCESDPGQGSRQEVLVSYVRRSHYLMRLLINCLGRITSFFGDLKDGKHDGSKDDPRVCLLEVVPNEIRYWVSTSSSISRAAGIAYGAVTGKARAPGEFRIISDAEVCRRCGVAVSFLLKPPAIDQKCPRLEREVINPWRL